jgi:predicted AAA+ superfamily ATPase
MKKEYNGFFRGLVSSVRNPLILRGARQVGKTYSLKEFGAKDFPRCHYVNFEEDERSSRIFDRDLKTDRILRESFPWRSSPAE